MSARILHFPLTRMSADLDEALDAVDLLAVFIHANRGAERRASRKAAIRFMILVARQRHGRIEERHTRHGSG